MHNPSHMGSARVAGLFRRYKKEEVNRRAVAREFRSLENKVKIVQPVGTEEGNEITFQNIVNGEKSARVRVDGKFAKTEEVVEEARIYLDMMNDHRETQAEISAKMRRLVGAAADKAITEWLATLDG